MDTASFLSAGTVANIEPPVLGLLRCPGPETESQIPQVKVMLMDIWTVSDSSALAHVAFAHSPEYLYS